MTLSATTAEAAVPPLPSQALNMIGQSALNLHLANINGTHEISNAYATHGAAADVLFSHLAPHSETLACVIRRYAREHPAVEYTLDSAQTIHAASERLGMALPLDYFAPDGNVKLQLQAVADLSGRQLIHIQRRLTAHLLGRRPARYSFTPAAYRGARLEFLPIQERPPQQNQGYVTPGRTAAVVGGATITGAAGYGLVEASGVTLATLSTASASAAALFTGGVALIVIAAGVAMYYGYQALQDMTVDHSPTPQKKDL